MKDPPEIFGLHENANIIFEMQESNRMIATILSIQPRLGGGGDGLTPDQIVLNKCAELLEQLPENFKWKEDGKPELFTTNEEGIIASLSTVLL